MSGDLRRETGGEMSHDDDRPADGAPSGDYWYNPETGEVEEGRLSPWTDRMGPYPTREAAQHALERARARTRSWDDADRRWREG